MNTESFKKGQEFENFVENQIFIKSKYDLIHRTNSYEQNKERFAEDTTKPDFKFRCKESQKEFYVEAKFRSKFNEKDMLDIMKNGQYERFENIQKKEVCPIYIVIGYGGVASNPNNLSLIPFDEFTYLQLYETFLRKFKVNNIPIESEKLNLSTYETVLKQESKIKPKKSLLYSLGIIISALIIIFTFQKNNIFSSNTGISESVQEKFKTKITQYYLNIDHGNIENLDKFINPTVNKWFNKTHLSIEEIKKETNEYQKKYPNTKTEIQWDTFDISLIGNDYLVTYKIVYKLKAKNKSSFKIFHLKITSIWDDNFKLKSMSEEKL